MEKKEYLVIRDSEEVPLSLLYDFYLAHRKPSSKLINIAEFENAFPQFIDMFNERGVVYPNGKKVFVNLGHIFEKVFKYFNEKFGVTCSKS